MRNCITFPQVPE